MVLRDILLNNVPLRERLRLSRKTASYLSAWAV